MNSFLLRMKKKLNDQQIDECMQQEQESMSHLTEVLAGFITEDVEAKIKQGICSDLHLEDREGEGLQALMMRVTKVEPKYESKYEIMKRLIECHNSALNQDKDEITLPSQVEFKIKDE
jgi:hypothetical protein